MSSSEDNSCGTSNTLGETPTSQPQKPTRSSQENPPANEGDSADSPCQFCGHTPAAEVHSCLLPVLRPVAEKFGRDKLELALRVAASNEAFNTLRRQLQMLPKTWPQLAVLEEALAHTSHMLCVKAGWEFPEILAVIVAVGEVKRSSGPRLVDRQGRLMRPTAASGRPLEGERPLEGQAKSQPPSPSTDTTA